MFWLILILPLMVPLITKVLFKRSFEWKEMAISIVLTISITAMFYYGYGAAKTHDTEILSGFVIDKTQQMVSCEHSYQCNPKRVRSCSGSGKNRSCTTRTEYDTCYEHSHDYDWEVRTSLGTFDIRRIDRRGVSEPPRWTKVKEYDPVAKEHSYTNYIKAVPDSLFTSVAVTDYKIPEYPRTYDYYRVNRVINNTTVSTDDWNKHLSDLLKTAGKEKHLNVIAILTTEPESYADALFYQWYGGKKNDVIMIFGVNDKKVSWFRSTSVGNGMNNQDLHISMRNNAIGKDVDISLLKSQTDIILNKYTRLSMEEFEYLKYQIDIPWYIILISMLAGLGTSIGLGYYFSRN